MIELLQVKIELDESDPMVAVVTVWHSEGDIHVRRMPVWDEEMAEIINSAQTIMRRNDAEVRAE